MLASESGIVAAAGVRKRLNSPKVNNPVEIRSSCLARLKCEFCILLNVEFKTLSFGWTISSYISRAIDPVKAVSFDRHSRIAELMLSLKIKKESYSFFLIVNIVSKGKLFITGSSHKLFSWTIWLLMIFLRV